MISLKMRVSSRMSIQLGTTPSSMLRTTTPTPPQNHHTTTSSNSNEKITATATATAATRKRRKEEKKTGWFNYFTSPTSSSFVACMHLSKHTSPALFLLLLHSFCVLLRGLLQALLEWGRSLHSKAPSYSLSKLFLGNPKLQIEVQSCCSLADSFILDFG